MNLPTLFWIAATLLWIWRTFVRPEAPLIPLEMLNACKAVTEAATKCTMAADAVLSWHIPAAMLIGGVVVLVLFGIFRSR